MPDHPPEWTRRRPATTVLTTPRISAPTARDRDPSWRPGDKWPSQFKGAIRVSVEAAAVLQGFRADYPWQGSRTRCFLQVGNAVCPPVARLVVAAAARHSLDAEGQRDAEAHAGGPAAVSAGAPGAVDAAAGEPPSQAASGLPSRPTPIADLYPPEGVEP